MQSYIFASLDQKTREKESKAFCRVSSSHYDTYIYDTSEEAGIEMVREVQTKLATLPLNSALTTIIIKDSHNLTIPAQNALLKILEEPPLSSQIILTTSNPELLLPTIVSRCLVKNFASDNLRSDSYQILLESFEQVSVEEKIKLAESLDIDRWVTSLRAAISAKVIAGDEQGLRKLLVLTKRTLKILKLSSYHINKKIMAANILFEHVS